MPALLVASALAAADPCVGAPAPASVRELVAAAAYVRVGREEERSGAPDVARLAYAQALSLDPGNAEARAGLARVCVGTSPAAAPLDEAIARMDAGDREGALALLQALEGERKTAEAQLLEGILRYELGEDALALPLLRSAEQDPALAASAGLFLGLIALRAGDAPAASARFASLAEGEDSPLRSSARSLLRLARREGRLAFSAFLEGGYDSNVNLAGPETPVPGGADAFGGVALSLLLRPWRKGPYLLAHGGYRAQTRLIEEDTGAAGAVLGYSLGSQGLRGSAEYELGLVSFGGVPYQLSHALNLRGAFPLSSWLFSAESLTRLEAFLLPEQAPYSGVREVARAAVGLAVHRALFLEAGYTLTRDAAREPALAYVEHGPSLRARWQPLAPLHLVAGFDVRWRGFDAPDVDLGVSRMESTLEGTLRTELELGEDWTLYLSVEGQRAFSSVPELGYLRFVGSAGVAYARGFW